MSDPVAPRMTQTHLDAIAHVFARFALVSPHYEALREVEAFVLASQEEPRRTGTSPLFGNEHLQEGDFV